MKTIKFTLDEDVRDGMGYGNGTASYTKKIEHVLELTEDIELSTIRKEFYNFLASLGYQIQGDK
jgi:hypothetical protein